MSRIIYPYLISSVSLEYQLVYRLKQDRYEIRIDDSKHVIHKSVPLDRHSKSGIPAGIQLKQSDRVR